MVINNFSQSERAFSQTNAYFEAFPDDQQTIIDHIFAYKEVGSAIPHTTANFMSGHYFPFSESEYELESSFNLVMQGFYGYALVALRSVLELGLLGVYFAAEGRPEADIRPWIESKERTPQRSLLLKKISKLNGWKEFDERFKLRERITQAFNVLDKYVHTRGYEFSSRKLTVANYNNFSLESLKLYSAHLASVTSCVIIVTILLYPLAILPLPVSEKFGHHVPLGGFLEEYQVNKICDVLDPNEVKMLKGISNSHPGVSAISHMIQSMPDLTDEDLELQLTEGFEKFYFPDPLLFNSFRIDEES